MNKEILLVIDGLDDFVLPGARFREAALGPGTGASKWKNFALSFSGRWLLEALPVLLMNFDDFSCHLFRNG
jgi:hypothetical protein